MWRRNRRLAIELHEVRAELHRARGTLNDSAQRAVAATAELAAMNRRANVLTVMYDGMSEAFNRRSLAYLRAQRAYVEMRNTAIERQRALQIATQDLGAGYQAIADLQTHFRTCPQGEEVFPKMELTFGIWTTSVMRFTMLDMRCESSVPVPFATDRTYDRLMSI